MTLRLLAQVFHAAVTERCPPGGGVWWGGSLTMRLVSRARHALLSSCKTDVAPEPAVTQPCLGVAVILIEVRSV